LVKNKKQSCNLSIITPFLSKTILFFAFIPFNYKIHNKELQRFSKTEYFYDKPKIYFFSGFIFFFVEVSI